VSGLTARNTVTRVGVVWFNAYSQQTADRDEIAQERERRGGGLADDEPGRDDRRADEDAGGGRGRQRPRHRSSSQISPTRS
jgi:hypothetical protein